MAVRVVQGTAVSRSWGAAETPLRVASSHRPKIPKLERRSLQARGPGAEAPSGPTLELVSLNSSAARTGREARLSTRNINTLILQTLFEATWEKMHGTSFGKHSARRDTSLPCDRPSSKEMGSLSDAYLKRLHFLQ